MDSISLKILTLNCWAIPYVSRNKNARINAIIDAVQGTLDVDVVCFQEIWSVSDYKKIKEELEAFLPHSHYFYCGIFGSGMCLFSRHPILNVFFYQWPLNGYMHKIQHADWFGGKGVGLCEFSLNKYKVNLYVAHLHAEYGKNDLYFSHRIHQTYEMTKFVKATSNGCDAVILVGDFNISPDSLAYQIVIEMLQVHDAYKLLETDSHYNNLDIDSIESNDCKLPFSTNNAPYNSYYDKSYHSKRIDYIFYGTVSGLSKRNIRVDVITYSHPFPLRIPDTDFSFSDHEAIFAELRLTTTTAEDGNRANIDRKAKAESLNKILNEAVFVLCSGLKNVESARKFYTFCSTFLCLLILVSNGCMLCFQTTHLLSTLFYIGMPFLVTLLLYTVMMAVLWSRYEFNALTSTNLAIAKNLESSYFAPL